MRLVPRLGKPCKTACKNQNKNSNTLLDSMFYYLDGQYKDMVELTPMKAYGGNSPAFIRLYALKIDRNCYLVIHMGIKLAKRISESPELKDEVIKRLDQSIRYLKEEGIIDREGLKEDSQ